MSINDRIFNTTYMYKYTNPAYRHSNFYKQRLACQSPLLCQYIWSTEQDLNRHSVQIRAFQCRCKTFSRVKCGHFSGSVNEKRTKNLKTCTHLKSPLSTWNLTLGWTFDSSVPSSGTFSWGNKNILGQSKTSDMNKLRGEYHKTIFKGDEAPTNTRLKAFIKGT